MNEKIVITCFFVISILSACLVWITKSEWLPSLSAFALSDNALYYRTMHISASFAFLLDFAHYKRLSNFLLGIGMALILIFDMYHYPFIHNFITFSVLIFACASIMYKLKGFELHIATVLSVITLLVFALGYFVESFHLLLAEIIAMCAILTGKLREIWK